MQMHLIKNETKAGPKTKKEQNNGPFIEPDLEESQSRREQLKTQTIEEKHLESLFFIPQDFSTQVPVTNLSKFTFVIRLIPSRAVRRLN